MDSNTGTPLNEAQQLEEKSTERTCKICGCTDNKACEGGCSWLRFEEIIHGTPDICSKCITDAVPECIELLVAVILETHQAEIENDHYGDKTPCSTCGLIEAARKIEAALRQ